MSYNSIVANKLIDYRMILREENRLNHAIDFLIKKEEEKLND